MEYRNNFEITWLPLWKCNFKCPYCNGWKDTNALEFQPLNTLIGIWDNLFEKIKSSEFKIELIISGGEPTIYPNFFELLKYFITKVSKVHVCTNLSFNASEFLSLKIPIDKVSLHSTFHPACISIDNFTNNLTLTKEYINNPVNFVANQDNLKNQKEFVKKIQDCGLAASPLFLKCFGEQPKKNTARLNLLNSEEEIKIIKEIRKEQNLQLSDYESSEKFPLGKKCLAGYHALYIMPNGNIQKCSVDSTYLGNIFDSDLNMYTEPQICKQKICPHQYRSIID